MNDEIKDCTTCSYAVFDKLWGEYKCTLFQHRIYDLEERKNCEFYSKAKEEQSRT